MSEVINTPALGTVPAGQEPITSQAQEPEKSGEKKAKVTFSDEQQAHIDKLLDDQYKRILKKTEDREKALQEAEKLKNMSADERIKAELDKANEKIALYEKQQLVNQIKIELTEKGLPSDIAEFLPLGDAEEAKKVIDSLNKFKKGFDDEIKSLKEQLENANKRGIPPKGVNGAVVETKQASPVFQEIFKTLKK